MAMSPHTWTLSRTDHSESESWTHNVLNLPFRSFVISQYWREEERKQRIRVNHLYVKQEWLVSFRLCVVDNPRKRTVKAPVLSISTRIWPNPTDKLSFLLPPSPQ